MIRTLLLYFTILCSLTSCKKSGFESSLTDSYKKWVFVNSEKIPKNSEIDLYAKFYDDGNYETRFLNDNKIVKETCHWDGGKTGWKYSKVDSVFKVSFYEFKVLKLEDDTIHLFEIKKHYKAMLVNLAAH